MYIIKVLLNLNDCINYPFILSVYMIVLFKEKVLKTK